MFFRASLAQAEYEFSRCSVELEVARQLLSVASHPRDVKQAKKILKAAAKAAEHAQRKLIRAQQAARRVAERRKRD
jgi:hypothetical protein